MRIRIARKIRRDIIQENEERKRGIHGLIRKGMPTEGECINCSKEKRETQSVRGKIGVSERKRESTNTTEGGEGGMLSLALEKLSLEIPPHNCCLAEGAFYIPPLPSRRRPILCRPREENK